MMQVTAPMQKDPTILNHAAGKEIMAERFYNAGAMLKPGEFVKFKDGTTWDERACYIKAIETNENLAAAYFNLARTLQNGELVTILGAQWGAPSLYCKVIQLDPTDAAAHSNLAAQMKEGDKADLGGRSLNRVELCLEAIVHDPMFAIVYMNLACFIGTDASVTLMDGTVATEEELFAKAAAIDPSCVPLRG
jgi:hypothetical protein